MKLTGAEKNWLERYREVLARDFAGIVDDVIIFGSRARGDARPDSDLDVLLIVQRGDWQFKEKLAGAAYHLAIGTDVVPSVQVYTSREWAQLAERESVFREAVERDGISVR